MSKIVLSFGTLAQGGASQVCANLSYQLCDKFDEVILITWVNKPQFNKYDSRAKWYCIEKEVGSANEFKRMLWFRKMIKRERPDLILSFLEPWNLRVLISTIGLHVPTIVAERNDPHSVNKYWFIDEIEKTVYRLADGILVQTPTIKKFFTGALKEKTEIIYNPVNVSPEMVGSALQTPKNKKIVSIARLMPQKNHDTLIRAFKKFLVKHPDHSLWIYGDGPLKEDLESLSNKLGIGNKVHLPGACKNIHEEITDAEMMCLVSSREGMSNSMIESMSLGLPCICTKVSGAVDLIRSHVNGILVDINDEEGLEQEMSFLSDNPSEAKKIGENASLLYETLNKEKIYKEWMQYIESILKSK